MKEIFANIPAVKYEGADSKNKFAFKFYDADKVILGKKNERASPLRHGLVAQPVRKRSGYVRQGNGG